MKKIATLAVKLSPEFRKTAVCIALVIFLVPSLMAQNIYKGAEVYSNNTILYGKFVMSMKMVKGDGMISSFFLYKNDSYIAGQEWEESDIEVLGKDNATGLHTNVITGISGSQVSHEQDYSLGYSLADTFHTYTLQWTPDSVVWTIDSTEQRKETGAFISNLNSQQSYRFNMWISCDANWAGALNPDDLPQYRYIDWIEYYSYNAGTYTFQWRDDFNSFDGSRWSKANYTFDCNLVDFSPDNAYVENGKLVLALTYPSQVNAIQNLNNRNYFKVMNDVTSREFQVKLAENGHYKIQLFDLQGRMLLMKVLDGQSINISYRGINPGIYLINVQSNYKSVTQKVSIE